MHLLSIARSVVDGFFSGGVVDCGCCDGGGGCGGGGWFVEDILIYYFILNEC